MGGIVSSIFGGGGGSSSESVSQANNTTNVEVNPTTNVSVDIVGTVDLEPVQRIADALSGTVTTSTKAVAASQEKTAEVVKTVVDYLAASEKSQIIVALIGLAIAFGAVRK